MADENVRQLNGKIAWTLLVCSISMIALLMLKITGVFTFDSRIILTILIGGSVATISPIILYKFKVNDTFLKYYMAVAISIFLGMLGSNNGIGIYITFVLVPVASCLYFDHRFTIISTIFSYFVMVVSVYFNSAGKMEVTYWNWTHMQTFRAYIIGFSIEYLVIALFLYQIINRSNRLVNLQKEAYVLSRSQEIRYQMLVDSTEDVIFEYYPEDATYSANRSVYKKTGTENVAIERQSFSKVVREHPELRKLRDHIEDGFIDTYKQFFEIDLSYDSDSGERIPLWFACELFAIYDEQGHMSNVIGKLRNITQIKLSDEKIEKERETFRQMSAVQGKQTISSKLQLNGDHQFGPQEFAQMASGHRFLAQLLESMKYSNDLAMSIPSSLEQVGRFFELDRISIIELDRAQSSISSVFEWNRIKSEQSNNFNYYITPEGIQVVDVLYDENGYIEYNPEHNIYPGTEEQNAIIEPLFDQVILGTQLWIPILADGKYYGSFYFDKFDNTPYNIPQKMLLGEVVNLLAAYVLKMNAEEANKAKSLFLSTMSHEIRTPMNAIMGMTEVALREDMTPTLRKCLKTVQSSSVGLLGLINDILDISKVEAGKFEIIPEKFESLSMINDVYEIIKARNNEKLTLNLSVSENLPTGLFGDVVRIKQVMINLCTNSIKYTNEGSVSVLIETRMTDEKNCILHFAVTDTGIGIREEDLGNLFRSYGQVDTKINHHKEGTGLGLSISKQLVELMNGTIKVESEYGKGSTFSFEIPLEVVDKTPAGKLEDFFSSEMDSDAQTASFTAPTAKVLLVDDSSINRMVEVALFEPLGMEIIAAEDGYDALAKIRENSFDLIFMDHFMPGMDGVETTKAIRAFDGNPNQKVPIIALTADAVSGVKEELLSQGMDDYLAKPIVLRNAYAVLERWLPADKIVRN